MHVQAVRNADPAGWDYYPATYKASGLEAIEVRVANREISSVSEAGQRWLEVYSIRLSDNRIIAMTTTCNSWRERAEHPF